jgi:hypothetical protein
MTITSELLDIIAAFEALRGKERISQHPSA